MLDFINSFIFDVINLLISTKLSVLSCAVLVTFTGICFFFLGLGFGGGKENL